MSRFILRNPLGSRTISLFTRLLEGTPAASKTSEQELTKILQDKFPQAKTIQVADVSGGCGAMYEIFVETKDFQGLNTVKQHRLITETLKKEIKEMHGLRIHTAIPKE